MLIIPDILKALELLVRTSAIFQCLYMIFKNPSFLSILIANFLVTVLRYTCLSRHAAADIAVSIGGDSAGFQLNNCFGLWKPAGYVIF